MPKSDRIKQLHATQVMAAQNQFETYKDFIVKEFVDEFAGSYQTAEGLKDIWRDTFVFNTKCEKFLLYKTKLFLRLLACEHNNQSPRFLKNLTSAISEYLSKYICKKGINRNECTRQLIKIFFTEDSYIQSEIQKYHKKNQEDNREKVKKAKKAAKNARAKKTAEEQRKAEQKTLRKKVYLDHVHLIKVKFYIDDKAR